MATIFKKTITRRDKNGGKVRAKTRCWYVRFKDRAGVVHQVRGYTDKTATQALAAELVKKAAHQHVGLADPHEGHRRRPVREHVVDFKHYLADKDRTEKHIDLTIQRVQAVLDGIGAKSISDIDGGRVSAYLKDRRDAGLSIESSHHYFRAMRGFCRWLVKDRRLPENPVQHLSTLKAEKDRRLRRRPLNDDEVAKLIGATRDAGPRSTLTGHDRGVLYITAAHTGLRAQELASLTPSAFDFRSDPATLTVGAAESKHREEDVQPLRPDVAAILQDWMGEKPSDNPLWPGNWWKRAAEMMRTDLERAGVAYTDASGRVADFHSLRHTFISNLARAKVHPKVAQALARHKTLAMTMNVYTHTLPGDLVDALANLPAPPSADTDSTSATLAATGTDGAGESVAPYVAPKSDFTCHSVALAGTEEGTDTLEANSRKSEDLTTLGNDWHDMSSPRPRGGIGRRSGLKIRFL